MTTPVEAVEQGLQLHEWLIIGATLAGPVLAVQSQKWIERARAAQARRDWIFDTLMATRGARISPDHVRALNSIDLAFYGRRILGRPIRGKASQKVLDTWHDYHEHLSTDLTGWAKERVDQWTASGEELFLNLLQALAEATHHKFDRQQLRHGGYTPVGHGRMEMEQNLVRRFALELLAGDRALKMDIESWPVNQEAVQKNEQWQGEMLGTLKELTDQKAEKQK